MSQCHVEVKPSAESVVRAVDFKVQIKMFFFIAEFQKAVKIRKIAVYRFLISLLVPDWSYKSSFRSKSERKNCRNQSKSIKFVTSCTGHVHGMKK